MNINILYCVQWNYEPQALSLRDELYEAFRNYTGVSIEIVPGARGSFEVIVDKVMVFSKLDLDRFPNSGEIVNLIKGS